MTVTECDKRCFLGRGGSCLLRAMKDGSVPIKSLEAQDALVIRRREQNKFMPPPDCSFNFTRADVEEMARKSLYD